MLVYVRTGAWWWVEEAWNACAGHGVMGCGCGCTVEDYPGEVVEGGGSDSGEGRAGSHSGTQAVICIDDGGLRSWSR